MSGDLIRIPFHGNELQAMQRAGEGYLVLRAACEDLGLDFSGQLQRLKRQPWAGVGMMPIPSAGGVQEAACLHIDSVPMWLATIQTSRVRPDRRELLIVYQKECARVLREHFMGRRQPHELPHADDLGELVRAEVAQQLLRLESGARARHGELGVSLHAAFERAEEMSAERARDLLGRLHEVPSIDMIRAEFGNALREAEGRIVARLAQVLPTAGGAVPRGPARVNTAGAAAILGVLPNTLRVRMRRGDDALRACVVGSAGTRDVFDVARLRAYISARGRGR